MSQSNRAWMPLHIENYLADTGHLTAAEHGAYMLLIMSYWRDGALPADERLIQRMSRLSKDEWAESRDIIAALFQDGWRHKRIDEELAKADDIIEKRRNAALGRHAKSKAGASAEQVQSKSTDTGVPPRTDNPSSLRSEESPHSPQGGGAGFDELEKVYPKSSHTITSKAKRLHGRLTPAEQDQCIVAARAYRVQMAEDMQRRGRDQVSHASFVKGMDAWLREGLWKTEAAPQPSGAVVVIRPDEPDFQMVMAARAGNVLLSKAGNINISADELEAIRRVASEQARAAA